MKTFWAEVKVHIATFFSHVAALPVKFMEVINSLIKALEIQISSAKGAIILIVIVLIILDIIFDGKIGAIRFSIENGTGLLKAIFDILKDVGAGVLATLAVVYAIHASKKA